MAAAAEALAAVEEAMVVWKEVARRAFQVVAIDNQYCGPGCDRIDSLGGGAVRFVSTGTAQAVRAGVGERGLLQLELVAVLDGARDDVDDRVARAPRSRVRLENGKLR